VVRSGGDARVVGALRVVIVVVVSAARARVVLAVVAVLA
jgi:hypothetical protein